MCIRDRLNGEDLITTPKTEKSNRVITMPQFLAEEIQDYIKMLYGIRPDDRMFTVTKSYLHREMDSKPNEEMQICSFLWVYYGFPTSCYEGKNVEDVRFVSGLKWDRPIPRK